MQTKLLTRQGKVYSNEGGEITNNELRITNQSKHHYSLFIIRYWLLRGIAEKRASATFAKRGFTLIELLVVITIIGILITLVTVAIVPVQRRSRDAKRKAEVNSFLSGINLFKADFKIYPNPTFYLGSYGGSTYESDPKNPNSNYAVATDIENCNIASIGATNTFLNLNGQTVTMTGSTPTPTDTELDQKPLLMKPGFASVNNFLICLRYIDRVLSDPKPQSPNNWDKYQYRVSYDYGDAVVTALLENSSTDTDSTVLFTDAKASLVKRYYRGSGVVVRHLDDSSDVDGDLNGFFTSSTGLINDGKYLYQCLMKDALTNISRDNRVSNEPIISSGTSWVANTNQCYDNPAGLGVVDAF